MAIKKIKRTAELENFKDIDEVIVQTALDLVKSINRNKGLTALISTEQVYIGVKAFISSTVGGDEELKRLIHIPTGTAPSSLGNRVRGVNCANIIALLPEKRFASFHPVIWDYGDVVKASSHIKVYRITE